MARLSWLFLLLEKFLSTRSRLAAGFEKFAKKKGSFNYPQSRLSSANSEALKMRLSILLILLVIITICAAKSSKSKSQKATQSNNVFKTKKHKVAEHKDTGKKHKTSSKKNDSKKKIKAHKTANKTSSEISSDKVENKTVAAKSTNMTDSVNKKGNNTKGNLSHRSHDNRFGFVDNQDNFFVMTGTRMLLKISSR